jgi:hypothetical protein
MIFYTFVPVAPRVDSNSSSPTGSEEKKSEKQDKEN